MGEGNDFVEVLIWPATERLLDITSGDRVLDIACGNGLTSRQRPLLLERPLPRDPAGAGGAHAVGGVGVVCRYGWWFRLA
jgi:hypothetical protein